MPPFANFSDAVTDPKLVMGSNIGDYRLAGGESACRPGRKTANITKGLRWADSA